MPTRLVETHPVRFPRPDEVALMPPEQREEWFARILGASLGAIEYEAIEECCRCDARLATGDVDYCQRCLSADYELTVELMSIEDDQTRKRLRKQSRAA